jgi:BirA family biotin operon repressor/biotin-[acetyl-CoA-carboxylase] ligase
MPSPFKIIRFTELDSTQKYARLHLDELHHADVILAGTQTTGIGQFGRFWYSPDRGNIYLTLVLETRKPMPDMPEITLVTGRALVALLKKRGITGTLKPPNDVLVKGKKIAGIIGNFIPGATGDQSGKLLIGVGINVNMPAIELAKIDQPATSFSAELGREMDLESVLKQMLDTLAGQYDTLGG